MRWSLTALFCATSLLVTGTTAQAVAPSSAAEAAAITGVERQDATTLAAALEAVRARKLELAREHQGRLSHPVARRLVDWALVDVFGAGLGEEAARLSATLEGWPREAGRRQAVAQLSTPQLPSGPVPYVALGASAGASDLRERKLRMGDALKRGDARAAYEAVASHRLLPGGSDYAEAEAFAGWLALTRLQDVAAAERHFQRLDAAVRSPVSKARAAYWLGRTAERAGDAARAKRHYAEGARHTTTFYGQLAAERAGVAELVLTADPSPTPAERDRFARSEMAQAVRLLAAAGERNLVRVFGLHLGETAADRTELALAMDLISGLGEQETSLLAYRRAAQRGLILHERGYPVIAAPDVPGGAEPALVLAVVRQESQFDPRVRSSADARGMMQLLPGTGREMARKLGVSWADDILWDPRANMQLGSRYLGELSDRFDGSYLLAAAGYNAGPGRPRQWVAFCGDPRNGADPVDFIECIPFGETRNYVMNVLSNLQVYRARLNGGRSPLEPSRFLRQPGPAPATDPALRKTVADS